MININDFMAEIIDHDKIKHAPTPKEFQQHEYSDDDGKGEDVEDTKD